MVLLSELDNSLFGLVLEAGESKQIEFKSERMLNITMASLDVNKKSDEFVPIVIKTSQNKSYIISTLSKDKVLQQTLQLMINAGENISFYLNCVNGCVNLTGYYIQEEAISMCDENQHKIEKANYDLQNYMMSDESNSDLEAYSDQDQESENLDTDEEEDEDLESENENLEEENINGKRKINHKNENRVKNKKDDDKSSIVENIKNKNVNSKKEEEIKKLVGGVIIKELKEGKGKEAKKGKIIHVYYTGRLKQNGKQFDSCKSGKPFKFCLGSGEVIKGWDVGLENMKVGGKRQVIVPPNMGYGNKKIGNDIPANSTLIFDVELKAVN